MQKQISTLIGIIIIAVSAVVLLGGAFAYQYFTTKADNTQIVGLPIQSQRATNGWKTYKNNEYSFQIDYPQSWTKDDFQQEFIQFNNRFSENSKDITDCNFSIVITPNALEYPKVIETIGNKIFSTGKGSKKFDFYQGVVFYENGNIYKYATSWRYISNKECEDNFNQILSTFKFTK